MIGQWNDVQADHQAYQARWRTLGRGGGESAELADVRDALADGVLAGLRWNGLQAAYGHTPRVLAGDPPFFVSLPTEGGSIEAVTLGSDDTDPAGPGGIVAIHAPLDCCLCVGPATGDFAQLQADAESWYLPLLRWLLKNQTLGQTCQQISLAAAHPDYRDVQWGGRTAWWYALRIPILVELWYLLPAG